MHPEGGTRGDEDKFFVLITKGVTVVSSLSLSHTHPSPLPFLFPRRTSQEARKGVLLLKCLCQGEEEEDEERKGHLLRPGCPAFPGLLVGSGNASPS